MNAKWITGLAIAFNYPVSDVLIDEYLENLRDWKLTADQWRRVKYLAKERFEFMPRISQLREIAIEVQQEDEARRNAEEFRRLEQEWAKGNS